MALFDELEKLLRRGKRPLPETDRVPQAPQTTPNDEAQRYMSLIRPQTQPTQPVQMTGIRPSDIERPPLTAQTLPPRSRREQIQSEIDVLNETPAEDNDKSVWGRIKEGLGNALYGAGQYVDDARRRGDMLTWQGMAGGAAGGVGGGVLNPAWDEQRKRDIQMQGLYEQLGAAATSEKAGFEADKYERDAVLAQLEHQKKAEEVIDAQNRNQDAQVSLIVDAIKKRGYAKPEEAEAYQRITGRPLPQGNFGALVEREVDGRTEVRTADSPFYVPTNATRDAAKRNVNLTIDKNNTLAVPSGKAAEALLGAQRDVRNFEQQKERDARNFEQQKEIIRIKADIDRLTEERKKVDEAERNARDANEKQSLAAQKAELDAELIKIRAKVKQLTDDPYNTQ